MIAAGMVMMAAAGLALGLERNAATGRRTRQPTSAAELAGTARSVARAYRKLHRLWVCFLAVEELHSKDLHPDYLRMHQADIADALTITREIHDGLVELELMGVEVPSSGQQDFAGRVRKLKKRRDNFMNGKVSVRKKIRNVGRALELSANLVESLHLESGPRSPQPVGPPPAG